MFKGWMNLRFQKKAFAWISEACREIHGSELGTLYAGAVFTTVQRTLGGTSRDEPRLADVIEHHRVAGFTAAETGLSLLDGAVGTLISVQENNPQPDTAEIISDLERIIDRVMSTSPGRILPRNGNFGRAADKQGLAQFLKPL